VFSRILGDMVGKVLMMSLGKLFKHHGPKHEGLDLCTRVVNEKLLGGRRPVGSRITTPVDATRSSRCVGAQLERGER
jgi:hypothetical protein